MAKIPEEEKLLDQQHFEAMQNKQARGGVLRHRPPLSSFCSVDSEMTSTSGSLSRYSRWPSLDRIKALKQELDVCTEHNIIRLVFRMTNKNIY